MPPKVGSLRKRGKYYYYTYYIDGHKTEVATGETSERKASKRADEIYADLQPPSSAPTVLEYMEWYLDRKTGIEKITKSEYHRTLVKGFAGKYGKKPLDQVTVLDIENHHKSKLKTLSPNTVAKRHTILKGALDEAVRLEIIATNPARKAKPPKKTKSRVSQVLTVDQAKEYLDRLAQDGEQNIHVAVILALLGGLRREEACGVRWRDVEFMDGDVTKTNVTNAVTMADGEIIVKKPKTEESLRSVYLPPQATKILKTHKSLCHQNKTKFGPLYEGDYVICDDLGDHIHPDWVTRANKRHLERYGLPPVRFHDLRHTHASLLLEQDVDLKTISRRLGHSTITITANTYLHPNDTMDIIAASKLDILSNK